MATRGPCGFNRVCATVYITALMLFFQSAIVQAAIGHWQVSKIVSPINNELIISANVSDTAGRVAVYYYENSVWLSYEKFTDIRFLPEQPVVLQVDNGPANPIYPHVSKEMEHLMGKPSLIIIPSAISLLLWHGLESEGCGYIDELGQGDTLKLSFKDEQGASHTDKLSLQDANATLIEALALKHCLMD